MTSHKSPIIRPLSRTKQSAETRGLHPTSICRVIKLIRRLTQPSPGLHGPWGNDTPNSVSRTLQSECTAGRVLTSHKLIKACGVIWW